MICFPEKLQRMNRRSYSFPQAKASNKLHLSAVFQQDTLEFQRMILRDK